MVNLRFKKVTAVFLAMCMSFCMSACGTKSNNKKDADKPDYKSGNLLDGISADYAEAIDIDDRFVTASAEFAINLFRESSLSEVKSGKNVMISPESIQLALSMTANGANGNTRAQMEDVLCRGLTLDELNKYNYSLISKQTDEKSVEISVANSLWIKDDEDSIKVNDGFLKTDKTYYNADAFLEPFDASTKDAINTWVSDNTNGMVKDILDRIDEAAIMYLVNAVAFEGEWEEQYKDFQVKDNTDFNNADGSISKVSMLRSDESYYMHDEKSKAFIKPYKGGQYGFMAILPNQGVSVEDYIGAMTAESFMSLYNSRNYEVDVSAGIPEFSCDYDFLVNGALISLGMTDAFDQEKADFTNMGEIRDNIYINRVLHKTHIEVDRNGTKAAAATVVEMDKATGMQISQVEEIILDRPFIYAIVDIQTGLPVFLGVVNEL